MTAPDAPFDDYRRLADTIPHIVYSARPDGMMEYYNRAWYEYTGQTPEETLGNGWIHVVHPDDLGPITALWMVARERATSIQLEFRVRGKDGAYRWFFGRGEPVFDENGTIVRWYGGCTDIDDLKTASAAINHHAHRMRRLANSVPQIVWIADGTGTNTFLNDRWYEYTGIARDTPHSLASVTHPDDHDAAWNRWRISLATGHDFETEYRLRGADGIYRWFLGLAVAVRGPDGKVDEWYGSCTDIEDRKRAEADVLSAYEREHRIATTLQRAFLSQGLPHVDGFSFDAVYRPAEREAEVGGDWYDAIELDDGRIMVSIGDVCGHGLDAAVVMGNVRQAIRAIAQVVELNPVTILDAADRSLRRDSPDTIVTAFVGIIDPQTRTLDYASAGHPQPLLLANGTIRTLDHVGLPLGLRHLANGIRPESLALPESGLLVFYTDGLVESTRDLFEGERRLHDALHVAEADGAERPARFIEERVLADGARDDVAVLTVAFGARARRRGDLREQVA